MNLDQLRLWTIDPVRTQAELQAACTGLGLATGGNVGTLRNRILVWIAGQPNLTAASPWTPLGFAPGAPAPVPVPAPAPAPVPAAPVVYPAWLPIGGALVGVAALVAAIVFGVWLLRQPIPVQTVAAAPAQVVQQPAAPQRVTVDVNVPGSAASSAAAPAAPASQVPSSPGLGTVAIDMLDDGRSLSPRSTNVLEALGYPPYQDTGVGKTANYLLNIPDGWTAIVGGVVVNGSRQGNLNTYKGPTTVQVNVTDGFYTVEMNEDALGEFCARLKQHLDNGWLVRNVRALSEWGNRPCG